MKTIGANRDLAYFEQIERKLNLMQMEIGQQLRATDDAAITSMRHGKLRVRERGAKENGGEQLRNLPREQNEWNINRETRCGNNP